MPIDSVALVELLQDDELLQYNQPTYTHYFYSYQNKRGSFRAITLIINRDFGYTVFYFIYDGRGHLISRFQVAGEGGDGRFSNRSFGAFYNDTTYALTDVHEEVGENDSSVTRDVIKRKIIIKRNGEVVGR